MIVRTLLCLLALLPLLTHSQLQCTLTSTAPHLVELTLLNTDPADIALLRWNLPIDYRFGGVDPFIVTYAGESVTYAGVRVKYADPTTSDYIYVRSNQSLVMSVDLRNLYRMSVAGEYKVVFESIVFDVVGEAKFGSIPRKRDDFVPLVVVSNPVVYIVHETKEPELNVGAVYPCSTSERSTINNAASTYVTLINEAVTVIREGNSASYIEWFGQYDNSRWNTASQVLVRAQANTVVAYQCDDTRGVYAYVYPSDTSHTIYLCEAFWPSSVIGSYDTQSGTLLHELSHFNNIGGTNDWVYGTSGARNLARTNPARAVNNADNVEYFGESQFV